MANYSNLKAAIAAAIKQNGNQEITGQVLQNVLTSMVSVIGANYTFAGVATPSTNPGTPDQNVVYMASQGGTYTNFGGIQLPAGISLLMWNGSWTSKTVMCGDGGVFDISVYKSSGGTLATFADISAALDGGNNIPASARKGGMSVKFVQSSDNKYVQYRLMTQNFTTDVTQWQGVDDEPTVGSNNLVKSGGALFDLSGNLLIYRLKKTINSSGDIVNMNKCCLIESRFLSTNYPLNISCINNNSFSLWKCIYSSSGTFISRDILGVSENYFIDETSIVGGTIKFILVKIVDEEFTYSELSGFNIFIDQKVTDTYHSILTIGNPSLFRNYDGELNTLKEDYNTLNKKLSPIFYNYQQGSLDTTGNIYNFTRGYVVTDYIPTSSLAALLLINNTYLLVVCIYDENYQLVRRYIASRQNGRIEVDYSDGRYVRVGIFKSSDSPDMTESEFLEVNIRFEYIKNDSIGVIAPYNNTPSIYIPSILKEIEINNLPEMKHIIMVGQSLSTGYKTQEVLPQKQPSNNAFMFLHARTLDFGYVFGISREQYSANPDYYDGEFYGTFKRLIEEGDYGNIDTEWMNSQVEFESPCSGIAEALYNAFKNENKPDIPFRCIYTCPGKGGTSITAFQKGTEIYDRMLKDVSKAHDLCEKKYKYTVGYFCWCQGESTFDGNKDSVSWYKEKMVSLFTDFNNDVKEITHQQRDVQFISYQTDKSRFYGDKLYTSIAQFEYQADNYVCAFPIYHLPKNTDHLHLTAVSSRKMGNLYGYAIYLKEYYDLQAFKPISVSIDNNVITLEFDRDITFNMDGLSGSDVDIDAINTNKGFFSMKNGSNIVQSVTIDSDRNILITCSDIPENLMYGYNDITARVIGGCVAWNISPKGYLNSDIIFYMPIQNIPLY